MTDPLVQYWDSAVFISYLTGSVPERVSVVKVLLTHVRSNNARRRAEYQRKHVAKKAAQA
jgi:hypothetical protein